MWGSDLMEEPNQKKRVQRKRCFAREEFLKEGEGGGVRACRSRSVQGTAALTSLAFIPSRHVYFLLSFSIWLSLSFSSSRFSGECSKAIFVFHSGRFVRRRREKRMGIFLFIKLQPLTWSTVHSHPRNHLWYHRVCNRWERLLLHSCCVSECVPRVRERNIEKFEPHHSHPPQPTQPPYLCFILEAMLNSFESVHSVIFTDILYRIKLFICKLHLYVGLSTASRS